MWNEFRNDWSPVQQFPGVAAWAITVLASDTASGQLTASVTNAVAYLPYLAVAACCAAIVIYATLPQRGLQ